MTADELADCLEQAPNQGKRNQCIRDFKNSGGKEEGGKVFTDVDAAKIASTMDGGKVFSPRKK